jgi:cyclophilin family peptidyl-prolyl cis-trans isomerase
MLMLIPTLIPIQKTEPPSDETFQEINLKVSETLKYFDDQRLKLAPVFNQEDSTVLSIEKATRGEYLLENFRSEISALSITVNNIANSFASNNASGDKQKEKISNERMNASVKAILTAQRRVLRALAEVGELLVDSFPYDVPVEGKFSFLPRLLGRAKITFLITRPPHGNGNRNPSGKDKILGNVTILADGFAAPITAGNFVDLSSRGFYTGLPVKTMKKRLGARPTLTMAEDNIVAYDIASTVDRLTGEDSIVQKAFDNVLNKKKAQQSVEEEGSGSSGRGSNTNSNTGSNDGTSIDAGDESSSDSILSTMPIMGSFNEGFYDPLTAKPRRIPLEIVQYDQSFGRAKLSYESAFSPSNIQQSPTSGSALMSVLTPALERTIKKTPTLLTFDIPGLVAMNHPDKNLNGGSSEFFALTEKDLTPGRSSLLNGKFCYNINAHACFSLLYLHIYPLLCTHTYSHVIIINSYSSFHTLSTNKRPICTIWLRCRRS